MVKEGTIVALLSSWCVHFYQSKVLILTYRNICVKRSWEWFQFCAFQHFRADWMDQMMHTRTHTHTCMLKSEDQNHWTGLISLFIHTGNHAVRVFSRPQAVLLAYALCRSFESVAVIAGKLHLSSLQISGPILLSISRRWKPSTRYHCTV